MNQILYTGGKNKGPVEIKVIIKFFAIAIIVFGIVIGIGATYAIISNKENESKVNYTEPIVELTQIEGYVELKINHDKAIDKIIYTWNEQEEHILQGKGKINITENIEIPEGNNTLTVRIIDSIGYEVRYEKKYVVESSVSKPEIEFAIAGNNVKIVAKSDVNLSYITYRWNDEEETKVDVNSDMPNKIETEIEIKKGENNLTVVAVNKENASQTKEQKFKGITKPEIQLFQDGENLTIKATDLDDKMMKIDFAINGEIFKAEQSNADNTIIEITKKLKVGENQVAIVAYNQEGETAILQGNVPYNP